jgi:hypothetical protein
MISDVLHIKSEAREYGFSARLRARRGELGSCYRHPMVRQIGAGTLPHETFRRYFEQNILYRGDYARAIGLILAKAPDLAATNVLGWSTSTFAIPVPVPVPVRSWSGSTRLDAVPRAGPGPPSSAWADAAAAAAGPQAGGAGSRSLRSSTPPRAGTAAAMRLVS